MKKIKIGYICVGNSCRSQIAEGFTRYYADQKFDVYSAGTKPAERVDPYAVKVMAELDIDISAQKPKLLDDIPAELDVLITMGCGVECPYIPCKFREDWGLDDPVGKPLPEFRKTRNIINKKVKDLIKNIEEVL